VSSIKICHLFPTVCRVLSDADFENDALRAERLSGDRLSKEIDAKGFCHTPLIDLLSEAIVPEWRREEAGATEIDLALIVAEIGIDRTKTVFRDKLLSKSVNSIQDTLYEIFATAKACKVLDAGSLKLEHPLPESKRNSDIFGTFHGQPVRIEVTVLHEGPLESIDCTFVEDLEGTSIASGFSIKMRKPLKSKVELDAAKAILRGLHDHHISCNGCDATIGEVVFRWSSGSYVSSTGPIESVAFYPVESSRGAVREVTHSCDVRTTSPKFMREDYPNPQGVFDACDLLEPKDPLSKRIRDMIDGKLGQLENGTINLVAFGNPLPQNERDLEDALFGAQFISQPFEADDNGNNKLLGDGRLLRAPRSPFQCGEASSEDEVANFIEPFKILSGVWHIRLGSWPLSEMQLNPNSLVPVPEKLRAAFVG